MGQGMAQFASKTTVGVTSIEQYDLYCHYVAGLVGYGLSRLFSASGLEDRGLQRELRISNSMGLFLQKTNIIRDYLEDLEQGRTWWPEEIWGQYGKTLAEFKDNPTSARSLGCLNHLVTNALEHLPDCVDYMSRLHNPKVFQFCAIPQVMAIATLAQCYNNPRVFTSNVKIRKGLSCKMMLGSTSFEKAQVYFWHCILKMQSRVPDTDPQRKRTLELLSQGEKLCRPARKSRDSPSSGRAVALIIFLVALFYILITLSHGAPHPSFLVNTRTSQYAAWTAFALSLGFLSVSQLRSVWYPTSTM